MNVVAKSKLKNGNHLILAEDGCIPIEYGRLNNSQSLFCVEILSGTTFTNIMADNIVDVFAWWEDMDKIEGFMDHDLVPMDSAGLLEWGFALFNRQDELNFPAGWPPYSRWGGAGNGKREIERRKAIVEALLKHIENTATYIGPEVDIFSPGFAEALNCLTGSVVSK